MDESTQLSAASAACAIAAVAINTMTLDSGSILGVPSEWTFIYRASPIFCVLAAVDSVRSLIRYSRLEGSLRRGLRIWLADRLSGEAHALGQTSAKSIFVTVVFFSGAGTQAAKIYATKGSSATHWLCTAYIGNYLIDTIIILFARRVPDSTPRLTGDGSDQRGSKGILPEAREPILSLIIFGSTAANVCLSGLWTTSPWPTAMEYHAAGVGIWLTTLGSGAIMAWPVLSEDDRFGVLMFVMGMACWSCILLGIGMVVVGRMSFGPFWCLALIATLGFLLGAHILAGRLKLHERHSRWMAAVDLSPLLACLFLLSQAYGLAVFYSDMYQANLTYRASWTSYLG